MSDQNSNNMHIPVFISKPQCIHVVAMILAALNHPIGRELSYMYVSGGCFLPNYVLRKSLLEVV